MTLSKEFSLESVEKPKMTNPTHQRRQKFIKAIDKQFLTMPGETSITLSRSASWVWQSEAGDWFVSPRYGKTRIELVAGKNAIKCSSADDVVKNLQKLKMLTLEGKLDDILDQAASDIRSRFGKNS